MRKKLLSLFLILVLCAGLAVPAMAGGDDETRVGFYFGGSENFCPYGTAASGDGWSYDGDKTFTLTGLSLNVSYGAENMVQFCNPDRDINIVVADGTVNTMGSIGPIYKTGVTKRATITFTGTGELDCMAVQTGGDNVVVSGPTFVCQMGFSANKLTLNSGYIFSQYLYLGVDSVLNGGIELKRDTASFEAFRLPPTYDANRNSHAVDEATGQAFVSQFVDQYGQPLQYKVIDYGDYSVGYVYDSQGEYVSYARFGSMPEPTVGSFKDVKQSAYYADPVAWAIEEGITNGTSATTFSPDITCTRGQIITFLYRAAGSPAVSGTAAVSDAGDTYYTDAVLWAAENGLFSGSAFSPEAPCTREMAVEFIWKYAGSPDAAQADFTDVSSDAVNWAVANGVTNGTSATTFSPEDTCTRAQIVTFLYRAFA